MIVALPLKRLVRTRKSEVGTLWCAETQEVLWAIGWLLVRRTFHQLQLLPGAE